MLAFLISSFSALLYVSAFIFPVWCWWMTVPSLCLLWFGVVRQFPLRFFFAWGCIVYGSLTACFIVPLSTYVLSYRMLFLCGWVLLVLYMASAVFVWAYVFRWLVRKIPQALCGVLALCLLISWFDRFFLWPFDVVEGCRCLHPLVPCMNSCVGRAFVFCCGHCFATMLFCLLCVVCVYWLWLRWGLFVGLCVLLFFSGQPDAVHRPVWLDTVCVASLDYNPCALRSDSSCDQCLECVTRCLYAVGDQKKYSTVIMPESTVPYNLYCPRVRSALSHACMHLPTVCLGAYAQELSGCYTNTFFSFYNGTLQDSYTKQHRVMFVERVPALCNSPIVRSWFLHGFDDFSCVSQERPKSNLHGCVCVPVMCSELFFGSFNGVSGMCDCALCLVNDAWFGSLGRDILALAAVYTCLSSGTACLYASYNHAFFCNKRADRFLLDVYRF